MIHHVALYHHDLNLNLIHVHQTVNMHLNYCWLLAVVHYLHWQACQSLYLKFGLF